MTDLGEDAPAPMPDGAVPCTGSEACDDHDPCTHADQCVDGMCIGSAGREHAPRFVSQSVPLFLGAGTAVGPERYLLAQLPDPADASRTLLRLVRTPRGADFEVLDELSVEGQVGRIESLTDGLAVYGLRDEAWLLSLTGDRLERRGRLGTEHDLREVAVAGNRLWACVSVDWLSRTLVEFDVSDLDAPIRLGQLTGSCSSVVAASAGDRAYVADWDGAVAALLPSTASTSTVMPLSLDAATLHAGHGFLTLIDTSLVTVVRELDLAMHVQLSAADAGGVLGALYRNARVTSRGLEVIVDGVSGLELVIYRMQPGSTPALVERARVTLDPDASASATGIWVSHDDGLRLTDLYVLDDHAPFAHRLDDPNLRWPETALLRGETVHLRDWERSVRVDVSDPSAPRAVASVSHQGTASVALHVPGDEVPVVYRHGLYQPHVTGVEATRAPIRILAQPISLTLRTFGADELAHDGPSHDLGLGDPDRWDRVVATHDHVYLTQSLYDAPNEVHVERWSTTDFFAPTLPTPAIALTLGATSHPIYVISRVHDDSAMAFASAPSDSDSEVFWQPLASDSEAVGPFALPFQVLDVAVHGERVAVLAAHSEGALSHAVLLLALERRDAALVEVSRREWMVDRSFSPALHEILFFDGEQLYVQLPSGLSPELGGIVGTRFTQLDRPYAQYAIPAGSAVSSFIPASYGIVVSMPNYLGILEPWCD